MNAIDLARSWLEFHEGLRLKPYLCTEGKLTVGYGHNCEASHVPVTLINGVITEDDANELLQLDIMYAVKDAYVLCDMKALSIPRQAVIIDMAFNLGRNRLAGFKKMFANIADESYESAAFEMMDSRWSRQVGERATTLAKHMENG